MLYSHSRLQLPETNLIVIKLSDIDDISDDDILQRHLTMPKLASSSSPLRGHSIVRITERTIVKSAQDFEEDVEEPSEALALNMVFLNTTIPVPRVRRVVKGQYANIIVMDYIPGRQLSEVWPSLSFLGRLRIAITPAVHPPAEVHSPSQIRCSWTSLYEGTTYV